MRRGSSGSFVRWGLAGEIGWSYMQKGDGNSSLQKQKIIDAIYDMTKEQLAEGAKIMKVRIKQRFAAICSDRQKLAERRGHFTVRLRRHWKVELHLYSFVRNSRSRCFSSGGKGISRNLCAKYQVPFVLDDAVELALEGGADGVSCGQSDMEAGRCRAKAWMKIRLYGVSGTDSGAGTSRQRRRGADYLGVGAYFRDHVPRMTQ